MESEHLRVHIDNGKSREVWHRQKFPHVFSQPWANVVSKDAWWVWVLLVHPDGSFKHQTQDLMITRLRAQRATKNGHSPDITSRDGQGQTTVQGILCIQQGLWPDRAIQGSWMMDSVHHNTVHCLFLLSVQKRDKTTNGAKGGRQRQKFIRIHHDNPIPILHVVPKDLKFHLL